MLMMNRVLGDWSSRPYATFECAEAGLKAAGIRGVDRSGLGHCCMTGRTGRGWLLLYNPSYLAKAGGMRYVALGDSTARRRFDVRCRKCRGG